MKKILFAASEGVPFIKTGGLADVVGALPKGIDKEQYEIRVIMPKYMCMKQAVKDQMSYVTHFYMEIIAVPSEQVSDTISAWTN